MDEQSEVKEKEISDPPPRRKKMGGWILLLVFISAWMFALGVLVGRGTAPVRFDLDKMEKDLAELKRAVMERKDAEVETDEASEDLTFYRTLKNKGGHEGLTIDPARKRGPAPRMDASEEPAPSKAPKSLFSKTDEEIKKPPRIRLSPEPKKAPEAKKPPDAKKAPDAIKTPDAKKASDAKKAPGMKKAPGKPEKTSGVYTIQVASVADQKAADRMVEDLRGQGYLAYKTIGNIQGKGMHFRVRIGHYDSKAEAGPVMKRLKAEKMDVWLVKE